jgi:hypothetical protein
VVGVAAEEPDTPAVDVAAAETDTPGKSVPRQRAGCCDANQETWSEGQALMQVTRLLPIRDWHSQEARAAPVSVPSQKDAGEGKLVLVE